MPSRNQPPDGYNLSRAALRQRFGTRRIDASAPQSARDTTPSGIAARESGIRDNTPSGRRAFFTQQGMGRDTIARREAEGWDRLFPSDEAALPTPDDGVNIPDLTAISTPPANALEAIERANAVGAASGSFAVPQYGGSVSFRRPSLMPTGQVVDFSEYLGGFATQTQSPFSFFKPKPRPSVLSGAQEWLGAL